MKQPLEVPRYKVTAWHGEHHSLFYVTDTHLQFCDVSYRNRLDAERKCEEQNAVESAWLSSQITLARSEQAARECDCLDHPDHSVSCKDNRLSVNGGRS